MNATSERSLPKNLHTTFSTILTAVCTVQKAETTLSHKITKATNLRHYCVSVSKTVSLTIEDQDTYTDTSILPAYTDSRALLHYPSVKGQMFPKFLRLVSCSVRSRLGYQVSRRDHNVFTSTLGRLLCLCTTIAKWNCLFPGHAATKAKGTMGVTLFDVQLNFISLEDTSASSQRFKADHLDITSYWGHLVWCSILAHLETVWSYLPITWMQIIK